MQLINSLALVAFAAVGVIAQGPMINTPASVTQCQPVLLTISGGTGPYFLTVLPGGQTGAAPLEDLGQQPGPTFTWNVDLAAGTSITLQVKDQTGAVGLSAIVTIQGSGNSATTCAPSSTGRGESSTTAASSTTAGSSTTAASSTTAGSSTSATISRPTSAPASSATTPARTSSGGASSPTSSAPPASSDNAALALIPGSAAGIVGALLAAIAV